MYKFTDRKINMQQVSRKKSVRRELHEQNSARKKFCKDKNINVQVSRREKTTCNKLKEQKLARSKFH